MTYFDGFNPRFIEAGDNLMERVLKSLSSHPARAQAILNQYGYELGDNLLRDLNYDCKAEGLRLVCFLASILTKITMPLNDNAVNEEGAFRWVMDAIGQLKFEDSLELAIKAEVLSKQVPDDE